MVRISAVVISSSAAKSLCVHMALVLASQFSAAAFSSAACPLTACAGAGEQAVTARLATAASETAAARILPVWFISAVPSCRVLVPTLGIPAPRGIGPLPRMRSGSTRKNPRG
jgi:hypothetical protein